MNLDKYDDNIIELNLSNKRLNVIPDLSRFKNLKILYLHNNNITDIQPLQYLTNLITLNLNKNNITDISSLQYLHKLEILWLSIKPFIVKEINSNSEIDGEMIKQVYQSYTEDEIENYENKVREKFKNYKFIYWSYW